jgi:hypothetical protein
MKITPRQLRKIVKKTIAESRKHIREENMITLANGDTTTFGTKEHLDDLESSLISMKRMRDSSRRGTSTRMAYSQAVKSLQSQLRSATRYFEKHYMAQS